MPVVKGLIYLIIVKFSFDLAFDRSLNVLAAAIISGVMVAIDILLIVPNNVAAIGRYMARARYSGATIVHGIVWTLPWLLIGIALAVSITFIVIFSFAPEFWRFEVTRPYRFLGLDWPNIIAMSSIISTVMAVNHAVLIWASSHQAKQQP